MAADKSYWEDVSRQRCPSWYLDRIVAAQKRQVHQDLIHHWTRDFHVNRAFKTDLFEEAFGNDHILFDLYPHTCRLTGMDVALPTVQAAARRCSHPGITFLASDARRIALASGCVDLVISTSTLDHFDSEADLCAGLQEVVRVVRPGGMAIVTLDNPHNVLYAPLKWASHRNRAPFTLGCTMSAFRLRRTLQDLGMEVLAGDWLIHNPRMISTGIFLVLRRVLRSHADRPIRSLVKLFSMLGKLPTRRFTASFHAVCARKPSGGPAYAVRGD
jgi:SAM-dependent methyltransferase